jgi:hypothetical protein
VEQATISDQRLATATSSTGVREEENGEKKPLFVLSLCKTEFSLLPFGGWGGERKQFLGNFFGVHISY